ncbi:MAG: hypothetical protein K0S65_930, partial [Labilithrix sp.]|nr:hypothetical protein [Labilithrix sp.]
MANCTKCSAELIGAAKFCATCGSPVAQPPNAQEQDGPSTISGLSAASPVNPFAATASPSS